MSDTHTTELQLLKPFDIQKAELQKLVDDYQNLVVTDSTLAEATKARKALRDSRLSITAILKDNKKILNDLKSDQELKADELIAIISPTEDKIDEAIKAIEQRKENEKKAREKEALMKIQERTNKLHELGMKLSEDLFILGENQISVVQIKVFSDEEFDSVVKSAQAEVDRIEAQRQADILKEQEEKAAFELEKVAQEAERKRLETIAKQQEEQQKAILAQQESARKESEAKQKAAEDKLAEEKALFEKQKAEQEEVIRKQQEDIINAIRRTREQQLTAVGMVFWPETSVYSYGNTHVSLAYLVAAEQNDWNLTLDQTMLSIQGEREEEEVAAQVMLDIEEKKKVEDDRLAKERAELLKTDIEHLNELSKLYADMETGKIGNYLKDAKSLQVFNDTRKMNEGIQEFIRLAIKNL